MKRYIVLFALLTSCAAYTPADGMAKTRPYTVKGVHYVPQKYYEYKAVGYASWYGPGFHGKKNAMGGRFDQNVLCAAHRTLPLPTIAKVTNLSNGKSVILIVNDRGPFPGRCKKGRIIDLSKEAARRLGILQAGVGLVQVETLPQESLCLAQQMKAKRGKWV